MSNFRPINRETGFLLPRSVDEWLPQRHLARFVVEVIEGLDVTALIKAYRASGSASYHPAMLLGLLVYGYATEVFSSRAIERATHESVAFRYIAGNEHPDHDTIATFRKRFVTQLEPLFLQVLKVAGTMGMLKLGTVALDGTKLHANASRHSALSYGHAKKIEKQLKREVQQLLRLAERADAQDIPDGMSIPEELERRESRLAAIAEAKAKIEARAQERLAREQAEYQSKLAARAEREKRSGKKPRLGHTAGEDGASIAYATREGTVRTAQADPGTGVRHHQIGDGLPPMLVAGAAKRQRRVEFGDKELEHQANVRDAALLSANRDPLTSQNRSTST